MSEITSIIKIIMDNEEHAKIAKSILFYKLRVPILVISLLLNISIHTIKGYISSYKRTGEVPKPKKRGKGNKLTEDDKIKILEISRKHPEEFGIPLARWTLRRLSKILEKEGINISHETVRQILRENGIKFSRSKAWLQSPYMLTILFS